MGKKAKIDLYLYACLRKDETGLPVNIRVDDSTAHKLYGHEKRILFQPDREDHPVSPNYAIMTISENPEITGKHELSSMEIQAIKNFVVQNREALEALADMDEGMRISNFLKVMKKEV